MFSCIKTQEGLPHSHAQQNWQTASETPKKKASISLNQHEILGSGLVSAQIPVQFSMSCSCLCEDYNMELILSPCAYGCTSFLHGCIH